VDGLRAKKGEGVGLIVRAISFQDFNPGNLCGPDPPTLPTDGQTQRRTEDMQS